MVGDQSVLEVGCGFGFNAVLCTGPYLGMDIDAEMVGLARRLYPDHEFIAGSSAVLCRQSNPPQRFSTGLLSLILHEAEDRAALLREMTGLCGRLVVCDFDPRMSMPRRLGVSLMEESSIASYWRFDPQTPLRERGWALAGTGPISPEFRWWEYLPEGSSGGKEP